MKMKIIAMMTCVVLALGLLVAVVSAQTATPTAANFNEAVPHQFGELINNAKAAGKVITFDFIVPLVTGERVWTLPDEKAKREISSVGSDYLCFSERWNDGIRERCTLFSNITSVTFLK